MINSDYKVQGFDWESTTFGRPATSAIKHSFQVKIALQPPLALALFTPIAKD
jgi:hypothetical protein